MHLRPDELIDIAEGARDETSTPHLSSCVVCRGQLDALKRVMTMAADVEVPEPSPLFWDHLSRRVSDAVAREETRPGWWPSWQGPRLRLWMPAVGGALAALVVAAVVNMREPSQVSPSTPAATMAAVETPEEVPADDDPSLVLVAELTSEMDLDAAVEAGFAARGSAEHAVTHMTGRELQELQRILKEEIANAGA